MGRLRFDKNSFTNLNSLQNFFIPNPNDFKGKWKTIFGNQKPIDIEIGSGKCKFITTLASTDKDTNLIGIEKFASVLQKITKFDISKIQDNCKVICFDACDLENIFEKSEIRNIYLNFSDPWPKARHEKRRLTSKQFISKYKNIMSDEGQIIFKTDNDSLYEFTLNEILANKYKLIENIPDINKEELNIENNIETEYEIKFKNRGSKIKRIIFNPF